MICRICRKWRKDSRGKCVKIAHEDHFSECSVIMYPDKEYNCTCWDESPD